jgi:hypothetical protein
MKEIEKLIHKNDDQIQQLSIIKPDGASQAYISEYLDYIRQLLIAYNSLLFFNLIGKTCQLILRIS